MMDQAADIEFMKNPASWPVWPYLPVKKSKEGPGLPVLGIMMENPQDHVPCKVWITNLYDIRQPHFSWDDVTTEEFQDFEGLTDAGWTVD